MVVGALVAVFTVPRGASDAATPAHQIGATLGNVLTVNVQEIPQDNNGAVIFNLSAYGDVDWFHLTGVECSNPYYEAAGQEHPDNPYSYCPEPGGLGGTIGRTGGYLAVSRPGGTGLEWRSLYDSGSSSPGPSGGAYGGVYQRPDSPVTYSWTTYAVDAEGPSGGGGAHLTDPGWWNSPDSGDAYALAYQQSGAKLEGVFYDPNASYLATLPGEPGPGSYDKNGYEITVAPASQARVLRFIGGAWQAEASVEITTTTLAAPSTSVAEPVPYYGSLFAGDEAVNALYTVYIPAGHGAKVTVTLDQVARENGHVALGGAALSQQKVAFEPNFARSLVVDTLDVPISDASVTPPTRTFNLSDPGGTGLIVDGWRHATMVDNSNGLGHYAYYTGSASGANPVMEFRGVNQNLSSCSAYYEPVAGSSGVAHPQYTELAEGVQISWDASANYGGPTTSSYAGSGYGASNPAPTSGLASARCSEEYVARVIVGEALGPGSTDNDTYDGTGWVISASDRYLYVLAGAWGATYSAEAMLYSVDKTDYQLGDWSQVGGSVTTAPIVAPAEGDQPQMSLYRVLVPAGYAAVIRFNITDVQTGGKFAIGGASVQHIANWGGCSGVVEQGQTAPDPNYDWGSFLTSDESADIVQAPYFQQWQLRQLLNQVITPQVVDEPQDIADWDKARLAAAYCEAAAWPDPSPKTVLHPAKYGYGQDNDTSGSGGLWPTDEQDEVLGPQEPLDQPMVQLTKLAFTCTGEQEPTPGDLVTTNGEVAVDGEKVAGCTRVASGGSLEAGSTVYWVYTVANIGLTGALLPASGADPGEGFKVEDAALGESCVLDWELTPASVPSGVASYPASAIDPADLDSPIWPTEARACLIKGVAE